MRLLLLDTFLNLQIILKIVKSLIKMYIKFK